MNKCLYVFLMTTSFIFAALFVYFTEIRKKKSKPKKKSVDPAKRPGLKEYLEAVEHWFEMYEAYVECDDYERDEDHIVFYKNKTIFKRIGYKAQLCSYCKFCMDVKKEKPNCSICLLSGDKCGEEYSRWHDFADNITKKYAKNMLLYVINCKPEDYKETDEYLK